MIQISCLWFLSGDLPPSYLFICEVVSSIVATKLGSSLLWDVFIGLLFSPRPTEDGLSLNHDDDVGPDVENYDDHHDDAGECGESVIELYLFPLRVNGSNYPQLMPENAECEQPTQHETIWSSDDENISKLGITRRNSSTDSRHGVSTIFLQFHFANGSWLGKQLLLLEYLKSFPDENFTAGNLHFNAFFDSEKLSQLSFFWTKTPGNLTNWPWD